MLILVAIITVRPGMLDVFRQFEHQAAEIMARYGGAIERSVVIPPEGDQMLKEIHIVTFPDEKAFLGYRNDAELAAISHLREQSVADTEIMIGEEGPKY